MSEPVPMQAGREVQPEMCSICRQWYFPLRGDVMFGCAVMHAPGSCCHFMERVATPDEREAAKRLLDLA